MNQIFLTPEEVAELLRVSTDDVVELIEDGSLSALQIGGSWRVTQESLTGFLSNGLKAQNLKAINRVMQDPIAWANMLREFPDVANSIIDGDFKDGTFGEFLQKALATSNGVASGAITTLHSRKL
ncbi:DNA binding domain-containing protein, excisionase family [Methylomagnum ishizawai]|uniref:DNA binding domain-containing protein, excisionase family n=1 Tax=Methylomagnum ishizawai TaxID=1760988 RepID=A0A1Y6D215_9GAMM|nr:helix-turn-helix domain-containing protein [Methylomagnum ishizawai]SMF94913.1 DNA binding domain-containing protein, excisionase family [Methylomagnum ishizawai]